MIKKTIITFFTLVLSYYIFVVYFAPVWWHASQHQWQENVVKAQEFLYNEEISYKNVIVGSSLSNRLMMDSLPNTYNLAFDGQGVFDGLLILQHKSNLPKNIFIEMNFILRDENTQFSGSVFSQIMFYPRKYIPSLREDKQPIAILGNIPFIVMRKLKDEVPVQENAVNEIKETTPQINPLFPHMLKIRIEEYSKEPNKELLKKSFTKLKAMVSEFEKRGSKVLFFEMPVNKNLENLAMPHTLRKAFDDNFPIAKYRYTKLPNSFEYQTTDGVHLNTIEAIKYTTYLKSINFEYFNN
jgi:hypothetical protein